MAYKKPQGDAGDEADECAEQERIVDFVEHLARQGDDVTTGGLAELIRQPVNRV